MTSALQLSIYTVSGNDATTLLQGQLTQDMNTTEKQWRYAAHCNPKGRVISLYITFAVAGQHYLITPTHLAETAIKEISKYIMRSDVSITASSQCVYFDPTNDWRHEGNFNLTTSGQFELNIADHGKLIIYDETNTPDAEALSNNLNNAQLNWDRARIAAGVPQLHPETVGLFTPESLNLDLNQAVSFSKGCYTGQEIVARMHYLGKAKQRLYRLSTESTAIITPNSIITNNDNEKVGFIVDIDASGTVLASLKTDKINRPISVLDTHFHVMD